MTAQRYKGAMDPELHVVMRSLREARGLSLVEAAEGLGMSFSNLSKRERGVVGINVAAAREMAAFYGASFEWTIRSDDLEPNRYTEAQEQALQAFERILEGLTDDQADALRLVVESMGQLRQ
jgi:transcriptional regulator with XRE-family HTH domain